jgi:hypothetical protein
LHGRRKGQWPNGRRKGMSKEISLFAFVIFHLQASSQESSSASQLVIFRMGRYFQPGFVEFWEEPQLPSESAVKTGMEMKPKMCNEKLEP